MRGDTTQNSADNKNSVLEFLLSSIMYGGGCCCSEKREFGRNVYRAKGGNWGRSVTRSYNTLPILVLSVGSVNQRFKFIGSRGYVG